ncbi:integrase catalytic domain-containing protein [Trichonephila clavipes]|nr:integrase catalytic domain-containing protein [Trichonephila clavipes]
MAFDILVPLPRSSEGNNNILVVMDYFTKWPDAYPISDQEASTVEEPATRCTLATRGVYREIPGPRMEEMHHLARERIGIASEKMKTRYDARATGHDFHEGDKVWLWNPKRRKGLSKAVDQLGRALGYMTGSPQRLGGPHAAHRLSITALDSFRNLWRGPLTSRSMTRAVVFLEVSVTHMNADACRNESLSDFNQRILRIVLTSD